jgi:hypothetical protein
MRSIVPNPLLHLTLTGEQGVRRRNTQMSVAFHYGLHDGWLECALSVNGVSVHHSVAGWHDGLRELIHAACSMFGRFEQATAYFQEEPGEFRWRITRLASNRVRVRVIEFDDWGTGLPDEAGKQLFDQPCGVMTFAKAIYDGSDQRVDELTTAGLAEKAEALREQRKDLADILSRYDNS